MDKMEVKEDVNKRLTDRHIDALYEAMDKYNERMDALEKNNEKQKK